MISCRYHCSRCGAHFTSLTAFDAHHEGSGDSLVPCVFPDDADLIDREGMCRIADGTVKRPVSVYTDRKALGTWKRLRGPNSGPATAQMSL